MPTYTQEFKEKVIAESATTSARKVAKKYDVSNSTISNWIKQANTPTTGSRTTANTRI